MNDFIKKRIRSIGYASKGAYLLLKTEPSIKVQATIAIVMTIIGFVTKLSVEEWCLQIIAITMVMAAEGMNTAVEKLADYIQPDHDPKIGFLKDVAAGSVFFTAFGAGLIGLIIYIPKFF